MKPALTFQASIDGSLRSYIDHFAMCYVVDILIYSTTEVEQEKRVLTVLDGLQEFGLCNEAEIGHFGVSEIGFLRFGYSPNELALKLGYESTIENGPYVSVLLWFTNFF